MPPLLLGFLLISMEFVRLPAVWQFASVSVKFKTMTFVSAKYKTPATLLFALPGLKLVVVPTPMRLILAVNVDSPDRLRITRELPAEPPWLTERTALALVTIKAPPTPVPTLVNSFVPPGSLGVAAIRPPVFVT